MIEFISSLLIFTGLVFYVTGSIGLIRFPDLFSRLHALSKADNVGLAFIALGIALLEAEIIIALKIFLIWLVILAASSVSAHLIARHALRRGSGS